MKLKKVCVLFLIMSIVTIGYAQNCVDVTWEGIGDPGPFSVGTLTEDDGIRNGPDYFEGTIYYPINSIAPLASIAIVPGFFSDEADIDDWGPFYASHGIVAFTIGTNSYFDFPEERSAALLDALETLRQENVRSSSPLFEILDLNKMAVSGWSMGGGGAQLAASEDSSLKAVIAMCPWLESGSLSESDLAHEIPVLIFSGENDGVAPVAIHADVHYSFTPNTTDKLKYEVANAGHQVANGPDGANGDVGKIALSWLKRYLVGELCYCPLMLPNPTSASEYISTIDCDDLMNVQFFEIKANLQGAFNGINMDNDLGQSGLLPISEPYTVLGFNPSNSGQSLGAELFDITGDNAIVDWIYVELRHSSNPSLVIDSQSALLQRDGDVVGLDGSTPVQFNNVVTEDVYVALRHRNHLGIRTLFRYPSSDLAIDFRDSSTPIFGVDGMIQTDGQMLMIAANANGDSQINTIDMNSFWRIQNGQPFNYLQTTADFDLNGVINSVDKNVYWRANNSKVEQLD